MKIFLHSTMWKKLSKGKKRLRALCNLLSKQRSRVKSQGRNRADWRPESWGLEAGTGPGLLRLEPLSLMAPNPKCPSADLKESLDIGGVFSSFFFLTHQAILISTGLHTLFCSLFSTSNNNSLLSAQWEIINREGLLKVDAWGSWRFHLTESCGWQGRLVLSSLCRQRSMKPGDAELIARITVLPIQDSQVFNQGRRLSCS